MYTYFKMLAYEFFSNGLNQILIQNTYILSMKLIYLKTQSGCKLKVVCRVTCVAQKASMPHCDKWKKSDFTYM